MTFHRRQFLQYVAGSAAGTLALGWLAGCTTADTTADTTASSGGGDTAAGVPATDDSGAAYTPEGILGSAAAGDRVIAQGLAEPVFLVITDGPALADYAISSVCPHRQCVVDWDAAAQEFVCPCHDSRFDSEGKVTQGPATTDLEQVMVSTTEAEILLTPAS